MSINYLIEMAIYIEYCGHLIYLFYFFYPQKGMKKIISYLATLVLVAQAFLPGIFVSAAPTLDGTILTTGIFRNYG